jgi:hypothetical protein
MLSATATPHHRNTLLMKKAEKLGLRTIGILPFKLEKEQASIEMNPPEIRAPETGAEDGARHASGRHSKHFQIIFQKHLTLPCNFTKFEASMMGTYIDKRCKERTGYDKLSGTYLGRQQVLFR